MFKKNSDNPDFATLIALEDGNSRIVIRLDKQTER